MIKQHNYLKINTLALLFRKLIFVEYCKIFNKYPEEIEQHLLSSSIVFASCMFAGYISSFTHHFTKLFDNLKKKNDMDIWIK